ncbi:MAG: hypothetical protein JSU08_11400 [Acidobacteria bacterium]|nr:hypothetical protein [Acidobacteriota bacterium]
MKVVVNGIEATPVRAVQNWGELLALLDHECAGQGVVVTDVAFDGVAQPSFRDPDLALHHVERLQINVDTARQADLILSAVGEALRAVDPLRSAAHDLASAFRQYDIDRGIRELAPFARNLATLVELTGVITAVTGLDTGSLSDVSAHVDRMVGARDDGDWVTLADLLDGELVETLDAWRGVLAGLHRSLLEHATRD